MPKATCSIPDCETPAFSRTWCRTHYNRWRRLGDPLAGGPINHRGPRVEPGTPCAADGCDEPVKAKGYCKSHYSRLRKTGDVRADVRVRKAGRMCSIEGCPNPSRTRTWCHAHYRRFRLTGDVRAETELRPYRYEDAAAHFWSQVDKNGPIPDYRPDLGNCWDWTSSLNSSGYGSFMANSIRMGAHRFALVVEGIPLSDDQEPDHLCRRPSCVRASHLEAVTPLENKRRAADAKTHCANGHPREGRGQCLACGRETMRSIAQRVADAQADGAIPPQRRRRSHLIDLGEVAKVYKEASAAGQAPRVAVALAFGYTYNGVGSLIDKTAQAGLLTAEDRKQRHYQRRATD